MINDNAGNDSIRSAALIAKTRMIKDDLSLQNDANTALNSSSTRFMQAGLKALDQVLERQKKADNSANWKEITTVRKDVERIANNPNADPSTRVEALNLIKRHFNNQ